MYRRSVVFLFLLALVLWFGGVAQAAPPKFAVGKYHTLALKADGTLWAWGQNTYGQLGDGTTETHATPVPIGSAVAWEAVAAGTAHTLALKADGTLWAWGRNNYGQLGNGTTDDQHAPVQVGSSHTWVAIAAGEYHTLALKADGTLWAWGRNYSGQLGDGTTTENHVPAQVGTDMNWTAIAAGDNHSLALKANGRLYGWGLNSHGQLGDNSTTTRLSPVQQVYGDTGWVAIAAGADHSVGVMADGTLRAWGRNTYGQVGAMGGSDQPLPIQVSMDTTWTAVAAGGDHTVGLKANGTLWGWGQNDYGQLGTGVADGDPHPTLVQVGTDTTWTAVAAGYYHTVAFQVDGTLWVWGRNYSGQLGDGTKIDRLAPVRAGIAIRWAAVVAGYDHTIAQKTDGTLWAWGDNTYGQLGDGTASRRLAPVKIGVETTWVAIAAGNRFTLALKADGTLWAWGWNHHGQLGSGTGDGNIHHAPAQIGTETAWVAIAAGQWHALALKADGTLWAWGYNSSGQLGDWTSTDHATPAQIGVDKTWTTIAAGSDSSLALKANGTLWAWGNNSNGQLGDGTKISQHSPLRIGTETAWVAITCGGAHTLALKADDTLWAWGWNNYGQLGIGTADADDHYTPVQIAGTSWADIRGGADHTLARKINGTLWAWGYNGNGMLGDGTSTERHAPFQIGAGTPWVAIAATWYHSLGLRADDTFWAWGQNTYGQLGDGTTTGRNVPTAVAMQAKATLTNPPPGTTLPGSDVPFTWSAGSGVSAYHLSAGSTQGGTDLANQDLTDPSHTQTLAGFPMDGRPVYVRLSSYLGSAWQSTDYSFTAATAPTLAFTGESGYTSDGVEPNVGMPGASFTFRVTYTNADGFAPLTASPKVHILSAGSPIPGSPFTLGVVSGTYTGGRIFTVSQTLGAGNHSYRFEAADTRGFVAMGSPTSEQYDLIAATAVVELSVSLTGSASGTVTSTAGGIICPGLCTATLGGGIPVTLTATPLPGAAFKEWRGACAGRPATCTLTPVALTTTTAVFKQVFTNDPLVAQSTPVKAAHFTELREAINVLRANCQCGLGVFTWSGVAPAPGGAVRVAHLTDLRTALDATYFKVHTTHLTFDSIQAGTTPIKASHLSELRNLVRALE